MVKYMGNEITCLVSTRIKEFDGSYSVLVTCLNCGHSVRMDRSFKSVICLSCGSKLYKTPYLSQKKLKEKIKEFEKELLDDLNSVSNTVASGFYAAGPLQAYKKKKRRLKKIAALPKKKK